MDDLHERLARLAREMERARRGERYPDFLRAVGTRKFRHPKTGNDVQFESLPHRERLRIFKTWAGRTRGEPAPGEYGPAGRGVSR